MNLLDNFCIKKGYRSRDNPEYFKDTIADVIYQPHVYHFAGYLAQRFGCEYVIDVGCGTAGKLIKLSPPLKIIGIDIGDNITFCRRIYPMHSWIECDLENPEDLNFSEDLLARAVIICADVIEHLRNPLSLLQKLKDFLNYSPVCLLSTPERDLVRGLGDFGPPTNPHHVREWNITELYNLLSLLGFNVEFIGLTINNDRDFEKKTILAILGRNVENVNRRQDVAPESFRVVAIMATYNEADVVVPAIEKLVNEGVFVYVIDNWSTDGTYQLVSDLIGKGVIGIERFPPDGPTPYYEWRELLRRKEQLARELEADWFMHVDADEVHKSPWQGVRLKDAIWRVDQSGFNAIDFTVLEFYPIDETFLPGSDFERHFLRWDFGKRSSHFLQIKAWKNCGVPVVLSESGGHEVVFEGRRVYPYKFLLKHYPVRGQAHGEKKIFRERKARYSPAERALGWHTHYDGIKEGYCFLKNPAELRLWDETSFYKEFLVERLSGIGIIWEESPVMLCDQPNRYARPAKLELHDGVAIFHGYQEYVLTKSSVRVLNEDVNLKKKQNILAPFFTPRYLKRRTVLDLGSSAGFFCFWALQSGAEKAIAVDMDETYVRMIEEARDKLGFHALEVVKTNVIDWNTPADIVLALALVHWVYSCTALFGSLDSIIKKLAELTKYMLIVEWIDPSDPAIKFFQHIEWNKEFVREPYTLEAFESALSRYFARWSLVGEISPTRSLYVAFKTKHEIDLSGPLPLIMPKERIISCRRLATHNGIEYWSCIYDGGNVIYKQATLDLAKREACFLSRLDSDYFPRVLEVRSEGSWSVVALEKVHGIPLLEAIEQINTSTEFLTFARHCLKLLRELKQKGITHRDIRPDNILVRDGKPVLIDFGWAISEEMPYFTPQGLGGVERVPDGSFCDVYSMGKVLEAVNRGRWPVFDPVIKLMTEHDADLRVTDVNILELLFASVAATEEVQP